MESWGSCTELFEEPTLVPLEYSLECSNRTVINDLHELESMTPHPFGDFSFLPNDLRYKFECLFISIGAYRYGRRALSNELFRHLHSITYVKERKPDFILTHLYFICINGWNRWVYNFKNRCFTPIEDLEFSFKERFSKK
jgi:hypothetical protein